MTRRHCARLLAGAAAGFALPSSRGDASAGVRLDWSAAPSAGRERRYRAHAQILVLSLPLVRWPNVGGGNSAWREAQSSGQHGLRLLEFAGFSTPSRAGGLNRLGFIRELSRTAPDAPPESLYFGLMTASPEETADEARKALHPTGKEVTYTTIDGRLAPGEVETVVAHFTAPANWSMNNRTELLENSRRALAAVASRKPDFSIPRAPLRPFLQTLADALRSATPADAQFSYAGRLYQLSTQKSADAKASSNFRSRGLLSATANAVRVTGKLRRVSGGKETNFRVWIEDGASEPLPLRIEYQARSYLRLVFEAEA
jgi:hypothetical protein